MEIKVGPRTINLIGKRFGKLIVISFSGNRLEKGKQIPFWECLCDCGNTTIVRSNSLKMGQTKSYKCGMKLEPRSGKKNPKWSGYEEISGSHWDRIRASAIQRNLEFSITIEDAWNQFLKQDRLCALSGEKLKFNSKCVIHDGNASLDRIDSSKGYITGNVQWVHKDVNYMKQEQSDQEYIDWCHKISDYQRSKNLHD